MERVPWSISNDARQAAFQHAAFQYVNTQMSQRGTQWLQTVRGQHAVLLVYADVPDFQSAEPPTPAPAFALRAQLMAVGNIDPTFFVQLDALDPENEVMWLVLLTEAPQLVAYFKLARA